MTEFYRGQSFSSGRQTAKTFFSSATVWGGSTTPSLSRFLAEKDQYLTGFRVEFLDEPTGKGLPQLS